MVQINMLYEGDLRCKATHAPSNNTLLTDAPKDNQGKGEAFSPTDLVATALGTCILTVMGITARKMNVDMVGAKLSVTKEMVALPVRRIGKLTAVITMPHALETLQQTQLEQAALACPVKQSMHPDITLDIQFIWG